MDRDGCSYVVGEPAQRPARGLLLAGRHWMVTSMASVSRKLVVASNEPPWRQNFAPFR